MSEQEKREEPHRELLLILLIVPLGIICMCLAGQLATRLDPSWEVSADMGSNLEPDVNFVGAPDLELLEPISSNILTQFIWEDLFLTPNAVIPTRVIQTQPPTPPIQPTSQPTIIVPTTKPTSIPLPTPVIPPLPTQPPPPPPPPPSPPPSQNADLGITKDDGITIYTPGGTVQYTIVASNAGPRNVTGATVTDIFDTTRLSNITWSCLPAGGATCTASGSGNINDTVNLPVGSTVTYTVDADIDGTASGDLVNTASISHASINDPNTSNNSRDDIDAENTEPDFGLPDGDFYDPGDGNSATFLLPVPIIADGDLGIPDLVYYEYLLVSPPEVLMDWVQIEISADQVNWYTVFFWGNCNPPDPPGPGLPGCAPDTNTNVNINVIGGYESDNRSFDPASLYNSSGVTIDVDSIVPLGNYLYIRITAPIILGSSGYADGLTMDAIQPYYP